MKQKGLAPILIVLLIAAAVGGFLIYQKQVKPVTQPVTQSFDIPAISAEVVPENTSNWKTYTNDKYDYSLNYPQNWIVKENTNSVSWESADYKVSTGGNIISGQSIVLFIDQNPNRKLLKDWWGTANTGYIVSNKISFKTDGQDSIKYNLSAPGGVVYGALISESNKVFRFEVSSVENKSSNTIQIFNQILSTFKFLDEKKSSESKEWKPPFCGAGDTCPFGYTCIHEKNDPQLAGWCVKK